MTGEGAPVPATSDGATPGVLMVDWPDPPSRNAIGAAAARRLVTALETARDPSVRVVVLGAGQSPFCSGWDVRDLAGLDALSREDLTDYFKAGRTLVQAVQACPVPVVAAVAGVALGFGCSLLAHADLVVAEHGTQFGLPEVTRGFPPATVAPELLEVLPARELAAWALTGTPVGVDRAHAVGLVHLVAGAGQLDVELTTLLARLTNLDGGALRATKALLGEQRTLPLAERRASGTAAAINHFLR